jgi:hypothetical protein
MAFWASVPVFQARKRSITRVSTDRRPSSARRIGVCRIGFLGPGW